MFPPETKLRKFVGDFSLPEKRVIEIYGNKSFVCGVCKEELEEDKQLSQYTIHSLLKHQSTCLHFQMAVKGKEYLDATASILAVIEKKRVSAKLQKKSIMKIIPTNRSMLLYNRSTT